MAEAEADKRASHRRRVIKGAAILTGVKNSEITCSVRNMHRGGAELRLPTDAHVPSEFLLYVAVDGVAYRTTIVWREGDRLGVRFDGTEPKPHWHYG